MGRSWTEETPGRVSLRSARTWAWTVPQALERDFGSHELGASVSTPRAGSRGAGRWIGTA